MKINSVTWIFDVLGLRKSCSVSVDKLTHQRKKSLDILDSEINQKYVPSKKRRKILRLPQSNS